MCNKMKVKHGVLWNSQTGKLVGIAKDMLDLSSVLKRLLLEEGDEVKPAESVNCWKVVIFGEKEIEGWMVGFFFNDGSLTGDTLLNQFDYVTVCVESINVKIHGLCMDAGGNNARFTLLLRDYVRLKGDVVWVDDELCYVENVFDPSRRIYFWFCLTHLFKAMQNQLLASQERGTKAFLDAEGFSIGWNLILKLNHKLKQIKEKEPQRAQRILQRNEGEQRRR